MRILVYGGRGALGSACISRFKERGFWVCSVDFKENMEADCNVLVAHSDSLSSQHNYVQNKLSHALEGSKMDAIVCVAGGWAGGNVSHKDFIKNIDLMWKQSVWSSCIASSLASCFLSPGGILILTGAEAALRPTPNMLGYGLAKAAVHQLTQSLGAQGSGLPGNVCVTAILPSILDTPTNRKWMSDADRSSWTPLTAITSKMIDWIERRDLPVSGSLLRLVTVDGRTQFIPL